MKILSIIVPFYNEEKTVKECLAMIAKARLPLHWKKEIILVDDGSVDNSLRIIKSSKLETRNSKLIEIISYKKNMGKGYAIRQGLKKATGNYVLIQDADLEYDPQDYGKLLNPIIQKKAEVVYGSRFTGERRNMFFWHMMANKMLSLLTNILFNTTLSDMEVGYKLFPAKLIKSLDLKENCFGFEPEVTAKVLKRGIKIYEVPISYTGRDYQEGKKIKAFDGIKAFFFLFRYKFFD